MPLMTTLYNTARRLAEDPDDAADLVQETYLRAYRTFENFRRGTNCKAWLLTIMYSVFINEYRRRKRRGPALSLDDLEQRFQRYVEVESDAEEQPRRRSRRGEPGSLPRSRRRSGNSRLITGLQCCWSISPGCRTTRRLAYCSVRSARCGRVCTAPARRCSPRCRNTRLKRGSSGAKDDAARDPSRRSASGRSATDGSARPSVGLRGPRHI